MAVIAGEAQAAAAWLAYADMDALPMSSTTASPGSRPAPELMHACGHDGFTTMLRSVPLCLLLAATRAFFDGTAVLIFQPGEEEARGHAS